MLRCRPSEIAWEVNEMSYEIDTLDDGLREYLERTLRAVPPPSGDSFAVLLHKLRRRSRRRGGIIGVLTGAAVIALLLTVLPGNGFQIVSSASALPAPNGPAPALNVITTIGRHFDLSKNKGKWVILSFVESQSCRPCGRDLRGTEAFTTERDERGKTILVVVNESQGKLPITEKAPIGQVTVIDDSAHHVAQEFRVTKLPFTVLVSPSGRIGDRVVGPVDPTGGILAFIVTPSQLVALPTVSVGGCMLTTSVDPNVINVRANERWVSYIFVCPGDTNHLGGSGNQTLIGHGQALFGGGGSGDDRYVSRQYFTTDQQVTLVRLMRIGDPTPLESMAPQWAYGVGFSALILPACTDQDKLFAEAVDNHGDVIGVALFSPGGPLSLPATSQGGRYGRELCAKAS
jgi:peroxiredoxin